MTLPDEPPRRWTREMVNLVETWRSAYVPHDASDHARAALMRWPEFHDALHALRTTYEVDMAAAVNSEVEMLDDDAARLRWRFLSERADQLHRRHWTSKTEDVRHLREHFTELPQGKAVRLIEDAALRAPKEDGPR